jgi:hypothetical protein
MAKTTAFACDTLVPEKGLPEAAWVVASSAIAARIGAAPNTSPAVAASSPHCHLRFIVYPPRRSTQIRLLTPPRLMGVDDAIRLFTRASNCGAYVRSINLARTRG